MTIFNVTENDKNHVFYLQVLLQKEANISQ